MKDVTIHLADEILTFMEKEAKELGIHAADLIRYTVGTYVQERMMHKHPMMSTSVIVGKLAGFSGDLFKDVESFVVQMLKDKAKAGELACKNCTMKFTEQDVDSGKCGTCGASLNDALSGGENIDEH